MLRELELQSFQDRRCDLRLAFLYRVIKGTVPAVPASDFITPLGANKRHVQQRDVLLTAFPVALQEDQQRKIQSVSLS